MGEVSSVACVAFLVEVTDACVLVSGAGFCLLVGRAASGGVFCGVCGLNMILGKLSAYE